MGAAYHLSAVVPLLALALLAPLLNPMAAINPVVHRVYRHLFRWPFCSVVCFVPSLESRLPTTLELDRSSADDKAMVLSAYIGYRKSSTIEIDYISIYI